MQIIIPMSGIGKRFLDAGYTEPKPLIVIDGKPIIEHVVEMFPGESDFIFICNSEHLRETPLRSVLERIAPNGRIFEIAPHKKGPVYAVLQVLGQINPEDEVIVNYCDFSCMWDYKGFLADTRSRQASGAVPAYRGFHPHMLGNTNYAFMRSDDRCMLEIKEKEPFTDNRMEEFASSGTYYFRSGRIVSRYFQELIDLDINLTGEYYVSLVYNLLVRDGLKVSIFEIEHMLQWGTPQDVAEYRAWSDYFGSLAYPGPTMVPEKGSVTLIPLAGAGNRFVQEGYPDPKPLIQVSGKPMIVQAAASLPEGEQAHFVCLGSHLDEYPLQAVILRAYPDATITRVDQVTQGQACTCELAMKAIPPENPLLIGACDNSMIWDDSAYDELRSDPSVDAIAWSFRHHPSSVRNPKMYGWLAADESGTVHRCSVKVPISNDPYNDHAIVGTFYFRKARYFQEALDRLYAGNIRVNGEFYVDSCINELIALGYNVKVFEVDHYVCWGTPDDLRTFEYWQRFFHKWPGHPYRIETDRMVAKDSVPRIESLMEHWTNGHNPKGN